MKHPILALVFAVVAVAVLFLLPGCSSPRGSAKIKKHDELFPAGNLETSDTTIDVLLPIYKELTGATLDTTGLMGQLDRRVHFPSTYPAMTRAQTVEWLDHYLLEAGIVVTHPDKKHIVFKLKR